MNELSPEARELLAAASGVDDPSTDDRARVRRALMLALATGSASAVGGGASTAAASSTVGGSTVGGSTVSGGTVGAGVGSAAAGGGVALGSAGAKAASSVTGLVAGASGAFGAKVLAVFAVVGVGTAAIVARPFADEPRATSAGVAGVAGVAAEGSASPEGAAAAPNHRRTEQPSAGASALDSRDLPGSSASRGGVPAAPAAPRLAEPRVAAGAAEVTAPEHSIEGARRTEAAHSRVAQPPPTVSAEGLAAELVLLRRARDAHAAGDSASAESALADHARLFPSGVLRAEREGTRALLRCEARPDPSIASEFERGFGGSPLLRRVRAACGVEEP